MIEPIKVRYCDTYDAATGTCTCVSELRERLNEVVTAYNAITPCPDCGKTANDGGHDNDCIVPYARAALTDTERVHHTEIPKAGGR